MADYKVTDTELTSIANAIRTKGGTQAQLEFPTGFVSAVQAIPTGGGTQRAYEYTRLDKVDAGSSRQVLPLLLDSNVSNAELFVDFTVNTLINDMALIGNNGAPGWNYMNINYYNNNWGCIGGAIHAGETGRHSIKATPTAVYYDDVLTLSTESFFTGGSDLSFVLFGRTGQNSTQWINNFNGYLHRLYIKDLTSGNYIIDLIPAILTLNGVTEGNGLVDVVNGFYYPQYPASGTYTP